MRVPNLVVAVSCLGVMVYVFPSFCLHHPFRQDGGGLSFWRSIYLIGLLSWKGFPTGLLFS